MNTHHTFEWVTLYTNIGAILARVMTKDDVDYFTSNIEIPIYDACFVTQKNKVFYRDSRGKFYTDDEAALIGYIDPDTQDQLESLHSGFINEYIPIKPDRNIHHTVLKLRTDHIILRDCPAIDLDTENHIDSLMGRPKKIRKETQL